MTRLSANRRLSTALPSLRAWSFFFFSSLWLPVFLLGLAITLPLARWQSCLRRRNGLKPRILRGAYALPDTAYKAAADRLYGYDSRLLVWTPSYYNRAWEIPWHVRRFHKGYRLLALPRYLGFLWSLYRFDIFQYYFDEQQLHDTAAEYWELPLLKMAGKYIILFPYGSDVMIPGMRAYNGLDFYDLVVQDYPSLGTAHRRQRVQRHISLGSRYADCIISCVPYLDVTPGCHLKRHYVAIDFHEWASPSREAKTKVHIAHASNHHHNKGTDMIVRVCRELESEGHPIVFSLLEHVSREELKRVCGEADIIIEQLLAGNIGMFGIECMAMGRPVVAYLREDILEHHPWMAECPIVNATPETLREQLLRLISDSALRQRLGEEGRRYVQRYHSLESIGALDHQIYKYLWYGQGELAVTPLASLGPLS